nr:hypothetical protein [Tanacetum cinerariifolium]
EQERIPENPNMPPKRREGRFQHKLLILIKTNASKPNLPRREVMKGRKLNVPPTAEKAIKVQSHRASEKQMISRFQIHLHQMSLVIFLTRIDDDITDDEDALPYDLAESDNEDLINVDDDGVDKMSADVARSHDDDGGGEDRPPPHHVPSGCMGFFANREESYQRVMADVKIVENQMIVLDIAELRH